MIKNGHILDEVDPILQKVIGRVGALLNITLTCGIREREAQEIAFSTGKSKVKWPQSKHNLNPARNAVFSLAIDLYPSDIDMKVLNYQVKTPEDRIRLLKEYQKFYYLAGFIKATAENMGVKVKWGGDFNSDNDFTNDSFIDMPHFELEGV